MKTQNSFSRRSFLSVLAATPLGAFAPKGFAAPAAKNIPIGLELYSVRNDLEKDLMGTVEKVAKMGYQCVEFFSPYYAWTPDYARQVRKELDDLHIRCYSTHNDPKSFTTDGIGHAIELNNILGTRYIVLASAGELTTLDEWKQVAENLNKANHAMAGHGLHAGYHNHDLEWKPIDGTKPMEVLAANTDKSIMLQLDVGTCVAAGSDPVAWVKSQPGRVRSMHLKEWAPGKEYSVLFGEGVTPWKKLFAAAEGLHEVEYYLIEQEGSRFSEMETARRCLEAYRKLRA